MDGATSDVRRRGPDAKDIAERKAKKKFKGKSVRVFSGGDERVEANRRGRESGLYDKATAQRRMKKEQSLNPKSRGKVSSPRKKKAAKKRSK